MTEVSHGLKLVLGSTIIVYVLIMYLIGWLAQRQIDDTEDYVVAGRRLPLSLAWATMLATWFGAGTLLTVSTEVAREGVQKAALDPLGAGLCLVCAGFFFARPLWKMSLLTVSDFFAIKFGQKAEVMSAFLVVPSYFGWVAAQFVALAHMLEIFFDLPLAAGILIVALVGTGYTLLGGMWSVTLTDALQISLVLVGLVILVYCVLTGIGAGNAIAGYTSVISKIAATTPEKLVWIPSETPAEMWAWVGVLCTGILGNLPGQDLLQRIFSARSAKVAQQACWLAGLAYLSFGLLPVFLGLIAASHFGKEVGNSVLPALAHAFMHPVLAVIFIVVIMSAVLSTIDSAILSPATVIAQNLVTKLKMNKIPGLALNRLCVTFVAACSLAMAYSGEQAYALLENAYSLPMVGLFVPLVMGLYTRPLSGLPAIAAMIVGPGLWLPHYLTGREYFLEGLSPFDSWQLYPSLAATFCALFTYLCVHFWQTTRQAAASS